MIVRPKPWTHASPSQVKTFRRCARKWWYEKVAGLVRPPSPAAELGKRVHDVAERYLLGEDLRTIDDLHAAEIFQPGRRFLPTPPVHPSSVEYWLGEPGACEPWKYNPKGIGLPTDVVPLVGRVDLRTTGGGRFVVVDHKTTSDERWARTDEELLEDVQAAVYARPYASDAGVVFRHVYYATRGRPRAWKAEAVIDRDRSDRLWDGVLETLSRMLPASLEAEDRAVDQNRAACRDYGGCPFRDRCTVDERRGNPMAGLGDNGPGAGMSLADRIRAGAKLPTADEAAERVAKEQREALARAREADRAAADLARGNSPGPDVAEADARTAPAPPNPPDGTPRDVVGEVGEGAKRGLRLPDGTLVTKAKVVELAEFLGLDPKAKPAEMAATYGVSTGHAGCNGTRGQLLKAIATSVLVGEVKRYRDASEQPSESESPEPPPSPSSSVPDEPAREATSPKAGAAIKAKVTVEHVSRADLPGFVLFVDCAVERWSGRIVPVAKLLEPLAREVEESIGTVYYAAPAYREGQRALAERLARDLEDASKDLLRPGDAVVLWSSHPAAAEVLDVLSRHALSVVRGVSR